MTHTLIDSLPLHFDHLTEKTGPSQSFILLNDDRYFGSSRSVKSSKGKLEQIVSF